MITVVLLALYSFIAGIPYFWQLEPGAPMRVLAAWSVVTEVVIVSVAVVYTFIVMKLAKSMFG